MSLPTNRIAVYLTAFAALAGGLAPVVAELDTSDTVGIVGGLLALVLVVNKWLEGWQQYEAMEFSEVPSLEPPSEPPSGDLNKYDK